MKLTDYEQRMLAGKEGKLKQVAMDKIVKYGEALGAEELCIVTKATLFCGAHHYLNVVESDDFDDVFSEMHMSSSKRVVLDKVSKECFCQTDVAPCDRYQWENLNQSKELFEKNRRYIKRAHDAGINIAESCTPYLIGWIPLMGEHFVTSESHVVLLCNSIWSACGNSDGIEAAFWSGICARTPKWGNHIMENRKGTHVFELSCKSKTPVDWDMIGYSIGRKLPAHAIPVISGNFERPDIIRLKQCFASMATTSGAEICHIVGITPEAPTLKQALGEKSPEGIIQITQEDIDDSMKLLCDEGESSIEFVSLGCPHYTLQEINEAAAYIDGKKIKDTVRFFVWTNYAIKKMADENEYTDIIRKAGGDIYTSSCPLVAGTVVGSGVKGMALDSTKQAHYIRSNTDAKVFYGDMYQCMDAAVSGRWEV